MVIKKAVYVWVIGILGMISFAACSSASQGEVPSTSNAALDNIFARKSVRAYLDKEVEKEKIDWMLRAGMAAPSGKDIRPWEFVLVTDRVALDSMAAALPYAKMLTQARYAIVVCGDSSIFLLVSGLFGCCTEYIIGCRSTGAGCGMDSCLSL